MERLLWILIEHAPDLISPVLFGLIAFSTACGFVFGAVHTLVEVGIIGAAYSRKRTLTLLFRWTIGCVVGAIAAILVIYVIWALSV